MHQFLLACASALILAACGGGGGSTAPVTPPPVTATPPDTGATTTTTPSIPTVIPLAASVANVCTPEGEKSWVRAHLNEVYLWYNEIVDVPPDNFSSPLDYFSALLVRARDRFSFTDQAEASSQYFESGTELGYGMNLANIDGRLMVTHVDPDTPAARAGIRRGAQIVGINDAAIGTLSRAVQLAALYPAKAGEHNSLRILDAGAAVARTVELDAAVVRIDPVPVSRIVTDSGRKIGYLAFTDHIATAERPLADAIRSFAQAGVDDVVLDVRYNGGGYLYIAAELGAMLGGSKVEGKVFEKLTYNDKQSRRNNTILFKSIGANVLDLPALNLPRVFVLTSARTCSASEAIVNALSPFMEVIRIGGATCGKPYGMVQTNNCGSAYFAIQFVGVNHLGEANYVNGFAPTCAAADDLGHELGDPAERLFAGALTYARTGACPAAAASRLAMARRIDPTEAGTEPLRRPWRENAVLARP